MTTGSGMSSVESAKRELALGHAIHLAASGRIDPSDVVSDAESYLAFLQGQPPANVAHTG